MHPARGVTSTVGVILATVLLILPAAFADQPAPEAEDVSELLPIEPAIWSISYWQRLAAAGIVEVAPDVPFEPAVPATQSELDEFEDSEDVCVSGDLNVHQSENSIYVDPNDIEFALNSNNSSEWPLGTFYGVSSFYSYDGGVGWDGTPDGWGGGDPAAVVDGDGYWYHGHIGSNQSSSASGVTVSYDQGETYQTYQSGASTGGAFLDKNHLWIDNTPSSPYYGRLYCGWTSFGGVANYEVEAVWSDDDAQTWNDRTNISSAVNAGYLCQGVNFDAGPDGRVYAVFTIYDSSFPLEENAIGFARSYDGGETWEPAWRIIENIRGIRSYNGMNQNHRKNSFPVMTVDVSDGPNRGTIYVVWTNVGVPGVNDGPDVDNYMIKSTDEGETWSEPIRINDDDAGEGNQHYFPWVHCDPVTGTLNAIWYDDRNVPTGQVEVFVGISYDAGESWQNYIVGDVSFTPAPIPGFAAGYFGDYLGIYGRDGKVYPCWTDNRSGVALTYVSPYFADNPIVTIGLTPEWDPPVVVPATGGSVFYDGRVRYFMDVPATGQVWTQGLLPNGNTITFDIYNINFQPGTLIEVFDQEIIVPGGAPNGSYTFMAKVGLYPNLVLDDDEFEIVKIGFEADGSGDWNTSDWFAGETAGETAPPAASPPSEFAIETVTPNPFNPVTTVTVALPEAAELSLRVFNTLGREVIALADGRLEAGTHPFVLDGSALASGVYFVQAQVPGRLNEIRKLTLLK
ncbi:MAG: hypothetical protein MAG453_00855 [Calditrichaeota bacterium]|nr:hypothetical protein [Calditrichota bacterium]